MSSISVYFSVTPFYHNEVTECTRCATVLHIKTEKQSKKQKSKQKLFSGGFFFFFWMFSSVACTLFLRYNFQIKPVDVF